MLVNPEKDMILNSFHINKKESIKDSSIVAPVDLWLFSDVKDSDILTLISYRIWFSKRAEKVEEMKRNEEQIY